MKGQEEQGLPGEAGEKILTPRVRSWRAPSETELRDAVERRIRRTLGAEAAAQARPWLGDLAPERLRTAVARLPYVEDVSALVAPDWKLEAEPVGVAKLANHAFGWPLAAGVLLELRKGRRLSNTAELFAEIPWLGHLREVTVAVKSLTESGWAVLKCGSLEVADKLTKAVDSKIVRATRFGRTR
jgi:hypothetical protein